MIIAILVLLLVLALIFMVGPQLGIPQNILVIIAIIVLILFVAGKFSLGGFGL